LRRERFGERVYFVPRAARSSAFVVATIGSGFQGSSDGPATMAPSMIPSSSAYAKSWVTMPPSWAPFRISLSVLRAATQVL